MDLRNRPFVSSGYPSTEMPLDVPPAMTPAQQNPIPAEAETAAAHRAGDRPAPQVICPYCGHLQSDERQCEQCKGLLDPLSRQATQNSMGPWFVQSLRHPFRPGCSYEKLRELVQRGKINRGTIIRGPTTRQFWAQACNVPGVAVLLGECHNCHQRAHADEYLCRHCGALLSPETDRQTLGLMPVKLLPGEAPPEAVAASSMGAPVPGVHSPAHRPRGGAGQAALSSKRPLSPMPRKIDPAVPRHNDSAVHPSREEADSSTTRLLKRRVKSMQTLIAVQLVAIAALLGVVAVNAALNREGVRFALFSDHGGRTAAQGSAAGPARAGESAAVQADVPAPEEESTPGAESITPAVLPPEQAATDALIMDPGLSAHEAEFRQIAQLEAQGTIESLEEALQRCERILGEARSAAERSSGSEAAEFPLLEAKIDRLKNRIDDLKLRRML